MGMASQIGEREDNVLCSDVRNMLFGPMEFSRRDLAALNIMRGRDNGLPDYNEVRKCHGLPKIAKWADINPKSYEEDPDVFDKLAEVYENLVSHFRPFQVIFLSFLDILYLAGSLRSFLTILRPLFTIWAILFHFELFWSFCTILGHFCSFLGHFAPFLVLYVPLHLQLHNVEI